MTYGDGVSDVDIRALVAFHKGHGLDATLTVVVPPGRFGAVVLNGHRVTRFIEKPAGDGGYINGGFYVLEKRTLDRIHGDATLTVVVPPGRFGAVVLDGHRVTRFIEKPAGDGGYINGGFYVLEKRTLDRIHGDETLWEREPLEGLASDGQLAAFVHNGYWEPMDTLRDKNHLEAVWQGGSAPWKTWE